MRIIIYILLTILSSTLIAQSLTVQQANSRLATIFHKSEKRPEVLLLGTYHFSYPDADDYKTPDSLRVDILSEKRQLEIKEVLDAILRFKPTKIAIEAKAIEQPKYDSLYRLYKTGQLKTERDERYQLAFRLAKTLGHDKVYCIDAQPFVKTLYEIDSIADQKYTEKDDTVVTAIEERYDAFYNLDDSLQLHMKLIDYLTLINSDQYLRYDNGQYLYHTRKGTNAEPVGADGFISKWFNRNVRIYSSIERITTTKNDRVFVLFGGGHIPILKFLLESSQEFELRKFSDFVK